MKCKMLQTNHFFFGIAVKFGGIAFLRDLPDLRDPVSESVSGVPTGVSAGRPGGNNFYCSF